MDSHIVILLDYMIPSDLLPRVAFMKKAYLSQVMVPTGLLRGKISGNKLNIK